jgi:hypothetical protein
VGGDVHESGQQAALVAASIPGDQALNSGVEAMTAGALEFQIDNLASAGINCTAEMGFKMAVVFRGDQLRESQPYQLPAGFGEHLGCHAVDPAYSTRWINDHITEGSDREKVIVDGSIGMDGPCSMALSWDHGFFFSMVVVKKAFDYSNASLKTIYTALTYFEIYF